MSKRIRICIEENDVTYKVTSIYLLSDGSFKLDVPYCPYDEGLVIKHPIDYSLRNSFIATDSLPQKFKAQNRPQLSIHSSGFVQFSGNGITSGVDNNGNIKGAGIYSAPLDKPISSGPTLGCMVWGLSKFDSTDYLSDSDIIIKQKDLIKRIFRDELIDSPENTIFNTYNLEIFVFPKQIEKMIWKNNGKEYATLRFPQYYENPGAIFTFPIIRLKNHESILGILPFIMHTEWPEKNNFGFNIGGPSGLSKEDNIFYAIQLFYPNIMPEIKESIDYKNMIPLEKGQLNNNEELK